MIRLRNVSKKFGTFPVIRNLSFQIEPGRITGLLGPNGAGKTTTMRLVAGYLHPDSGEIWVGGKNTAKDIMAVRRNLGYLPENTPLYPDMNVLEYLEMAGRLHGLGGKELRRSIAGMVSVCGLERNLKKRVGTLSKGYSQRLGLAQAMIHDPGILVLDEPTTGLDPNQIRYIKDLIREMGERKTLMVSTHILNQVPEICDQVLVIHRGELVFDGTPRTLLEHAGIPGSARLVTDRDEAALASLIKGFPFVERWVKESEADGLIHYRLGGRFSPESMILVFKALQERSWRVAQWAAEPATLEEVFAELTQKEDHENAFPNR